MFTVERVFFASILFSRFLITFTVLGPFSCILDIFRIFAVFCRHCFSPFAKIYVGHAREINTFYSNIYNSFTIWRTNLSNNVITIKSGKTIIFGEVLLYANCQ